MARTISSTPLGSIPSNPARADPARADAARGDAARADPARGDLDGTLRAALIESRQRMKELLELSCDFAWETDLNGLFSFLTSGGALGHEILDLLGSDPADLMLSPED